jgi:peptide/nickel transport system permease protein
MVAKKLVYVVLMLLFISLLSFFMIHLAPNSFISGGELNPNMTKEAIETLKEIYGLNKPLYKQYIDWVLNLSSLNFGVSFVSGEAVLDEIKKRIGITLAINTVSMFFVFVVSIYLGIKSSGLL